MSSIDVACLACGQPIPQESARRTVLVNKHTPRYLHPTWEACAQALTRPGALPHAPIATTSLRPLETLADL